VYAAASLATALSADEPVRNPAEQAAVAQLKQFGGVLIHYNDRLPGRPVVLVDFTNHQGFKDEWLKPLAALPHLSGVGLAGTAVTDEGLRYLKSLRSLETLTLAETKITDEGLAELIGLKSLRVLDVRGTGVTAAGATVLKRFLPEVEVSFGPMPGAEPPAAGSTVPAAPSSTMPADVGPADAAPADPAPATPPVPGVKAEMPSVARIKELREKAAELTQPGEDDAPEPEGWSKSRHDPNKLMDLFKPLRLKKDFVLRAYLHREGGNGTGVVWAMPADAEFPEPKDCPALEQHMLKAPKPWDALDDPMQTVEGDDSEWSYLAASLLRRELREFGALWHGVNWGVHTILDADPWKAGPPPDDADPLQHPHSPQPEWRWHEPRPAHWAPRVEMTPDRVTVTFHTYCPLHEESIVRHTDTYRRGQYRAKVEEVRIADAPGGIAF
jgi:hypothetical protein